MRLRGVLTGLLLLLATSPAAAAWTKVGESTFTVAVGTGSENKSLPGSPATNDIVLVFLASDSAIDPPTEGVTTAGYTQIDVGTQTATPGRQAAYKIMGGTPDTQVTIGQEGTSITAGVIQVWRGVDTTTPLDDTADTATGTTGLPDPAETTTVTNGALVFGVGFLDDDDDAANTTAPAGYSNLKAADTGQSSTTVGATVMVASIEKATAGAENPGVFGGAGDDAWRTTTFSLRPGAGGPAVKTKQRGRVLAMNWFDATLVSPAAPGGGPPPTPTPGPGGGYITGGWASDMVAGDNSTVCPVTNLNDTGTGSLRDCLHDKSNRRITFSVSGTITLASFVRPGSNVTIDGLTAPSPGITISGGSSDATLRFWKSGTTLSDIRVRGVRFRNCTGDCISVGNNNSGTTFGDGSPATRVHITRSSFATCGDGNVDITGGSTFVTMDYSILAACTRNNLIKYDGVSRIALHHNVFVNSTSRNPQVNFHPEASNPFVDPNTTVHMQNNIVWGWGDSGYGTSIECGARANVIENLYKCNNGGTCSASRKEKHLLINFNNPGCINPVLYAAGNDTADSGTPDPDTVGNTGTEQPRMSPDLSDTTETACTAAVNSKALAGVRPLDATDQAALNSITLPTC